MAAGSPPGNQMGDGSRGNEGEHLGGARSVSQIGAAVEELDALTRIADMTPWLRQRSLGTHVRHGLRAGPVGIPDSRPHPALPASMPLPTVPGGASRLMGAWSPPGSPGDELTSTEMAAAMMKREREDLGAREHALECQRASCLLQAEVLTQKHWHS